MPDNVDNGRETISEDQPTLLQRDDRTPLRDATQVPASPSSAREESGRLRAFVDRVRCSRLPLPGRDTASSYVRMRDGERSGGSNSPRSPGTRGRRSPRDEEALYRDISDNAKRSPRGAAGTSSSPRSARGGREQAYIRHGRDGGRDRSTPRRAQQHDTFLEDSSSDEENEVSDETARYVTKEYLMPLFERIGLFESVYGGNRQHISSGSPSRNSPGRGVPLLHELLLSDRLLGKLQDYHRSVAQKKKELQDAQAARKAAQRELAGARARMEVSDYLRGVDELRRHSHEHDNAAVQRQCEALEKVTQYLSAKTALEFAENSKLKSTASEREETLSAARMQVAKHLQAASAAKLHNEVLANEIAQLEPALACLKVGPRARRLLQEARQYFETEIHSAFDMKDRLESRLVFLVQDKNALEQSRTNLLKGNEDLEGEKEQLLEEQEEMKDVMREELKEALNDKDLLRKERDKLEMKVKDLSQDRDTLKQRLKKYRRLKVDEHKTCKNCNKDYMENENFNWSCRTHQSEFGGEMWWCCGKIGKEAIGCKFSKHESKDDEEDLDEQDRAEREEREIKARNSKIKCYSCKESGHIAKNCPKDPNLRSLHDPAVEVQRTDILGEQAGWQKALARESMLRPTEVLSRIETKLGFDTWDEDVEAVINPLQDVLELCEKATDRFHAMYLYEDEAERLALEERAAREKQPSATRRGGVVNAAALMSGTRGGLPGLLAGIQLASEDDEEEEDSDDDDDSDEDEDDDSEDEEESDGEEAESSGESSSGFDDDSEDES
ncbi:unnamed protein product [Amoebophrya sp. A25]|nr:unnamed protein product [Amoebophrya sp. A25]|eukprot:GSA25T00001728001.1